MYVTPFLVGGFGNRIFQLLACFHISEQTGRIPVIDPKAIAHNPHESFHETLQQLKELFPMLKEHTAVWANTYETRGFQYEPEVFTKFPNNIPLKLTGYFQAYEWIPKRLPPLAHTVYPTTVFLHIRLGDYVGGGFDLNLQDKYFSRAVQRILAQKPDVTEFLVFSDDPEQAEQIVKGLEIPYRMSPAKKSLDVLREMASCSGGICSNSSLSYLGAVFQEGHRGPVVIPSIWGKSGVKGIQAPWAESIDPK